MEPVFDTDIYGPPNKFEGYNFSIPIDEDHDRNPLQSRQDLVKKISSYTAPKHLFEETHNPQGEEEDYRKPQRIIDRENDYRKRRLKRKLSPPRYDPFAASDASPDASLSTYVDVMREQFLKRREEETYRAVLKKKGLESRGKEKEKDGKGREGRCDLKGSGFSSDNSKDRVSGGGSKRRRP